MKNKMKIMLMLFSFVCVKLNATPSTQVWNPSTDIQPAGTWHLGIDNYFSVKENAAKPYAFPTDTGITYGFTKNLEAGLDLMYPSEYPLSLNLKYGIAEEEKRPALAAGVFGIGTKKNVTDLNIIYGVAAKTIEKAGRFSAGFYSGDDKLLADETGKAESSGIIATWDKAFSKKMWASVDYTSGDNVYGSLSFGASYAFSPAASVIFGYVVYNNEVLNTNNTFTTQLDINF